MTTESPVPWEDESRRQELPSTLAQVIVVRTRTLVVPRSTVAKIKATHPTDFASLNRLAQLLDGVELDRALAQQAKSS